MLLNQNPAELDFFFVIIISILFFGGDSYNSEHSVYLSDMAIPSPGPSGASKRGTIYSLALLTWL